MIATRPCCFQSCDNIMLEMVVQKKSNAKKARSKALTIRYASNEQNVACYLQVL